MRICTAPTTRYRNCVLEKHEWVEEHLGLEWVGRMVLTRDKTLVRGAVLIDDRPDISGAMTPEWQHVVFDAPYNRHLPGPRMTWATWREVLPPLLG